MVLINADTFEQWFDLGPFSFTLQDAYTTAPGHCRLSIRHVDHYHIGGYYPHGTPLTNVRRDAANYVLTRCLRWSQAARRFKESAGGGW